MVNAQSVWNKDQVILDYMLLHGTDLPVIMETWLMHSDHDKTWSQLTC